MYRALERLDEEIVVLHGLEYTHHQYRICDTNHVRKNCIKCKNPSNVEGESDFVVIGKNYFVVIEVKNIPHGKDEHITESKVRECSAALKKAQKQAEKVKSLITNITKGMGLKEFPIFTFSAFPNTNRILLQNINNKTHEFSVDKQLLCLYDHPDLRSWWKNNVTDIVNNEADSLKQEQINDVLLAIWCTDKNQCDETRCCLSKSIQDIDEELRKGTITFITKNRLPNPNVIKVTDIESAMINSETNIFRDFIGVDYLTMEQYDAFNWWVQLASTFH